MIDDIKEKFYATLDFLLAEKYNLLKIILIPTLLLILIDITLALYLANGTSPFTNSLILGILYILTIGLASGFVLLKVHKYFLLRENIAFNIKSLITLTSSSKKFLLIYMIPYFLLSIALTILLLIASNSEPFRFISLILLIMIFIFISCYIVFTILYPFTLPHLALDRSFDIERIYHLSTGYRLKIFISFSAITLFAFLLLFIIKNTLLVIYTLHGSVHIHIFSNALILYPIACAALPAISTILCTYYAESREKNDAILIKIEHDIDNNQTLR